MLYPNPDILLYTAIGDAYCASCEYIKLPHDKETYNKALNFNQYLSHPRHNLVPGTYTDDTSMSAANAKVLIENDSFTNICFAEAWVNEFKQDPRDAYSRRFQKFLEEVETGKEFLDKIDPVSNKNGAAMRSAVLGVLKIPSIVRTVADGQAKITHNTPGGRFGSQAVALMSHYVLYENSPLERDLLKTYLRYHLRHIIAESEALTDVFRRPWAGPVAGPEVGINTALATFELLVSCNSLLEVLRKTIEFGGDTDTCASIALGIASARMPDDLPAFMHNDLEKGSDFGAKYLKSLGSKLMRKYAE